MYYLIQKNIFQDPRYDEIFHVMKALNLPFQEVSFQPNSTELNIETTRKDIFVYGSVKLAKTATNYDWKPGSFYGNNHEYEKYSVGYGANILNHGSFIKQFSEAFNWDTNQTLFIKPSKDAKVFTGKVFSKPEWEDFVYNTLNSNEDSRVDGTTQIQISKSHNVIKEARVWIINRKVITSSYYLFHGNVEYEENVSEDGLRFAKEMADLYNVADAYVMDICKTHNGWKIMEVNCINSAGFYKADVKAIIIALEKFYE